MEAPRKVERAGSRRVEQGRRSKFRKRVALKSLTNQTEDAAAGEKK